MQAIRTKYIGPTNYRGSRIKAIATAGSITLSWAHNLNSDENHRSAALALATKLGWTYGPFIGGTLDSGDCVYVCQLDPRDTFTVPKEATTCQQK